MIYYQSNLALVRTSEYKDIKEIANFMRIEDITEIWRAAHKTPEEALLNGFKESVLCMTVEKDKKAIAMFGIIPVSYIGTHAIIWLLGTPEIEKIRRTFAKYSKRFIRKFLQYYPLLTNCVDVDNRKTIRWLKWCKAEFGKMEPYGAEQQPFLPFQFRRNYV